MKVNFILNALDGHSYKRIEEFKELGYDIKVYGFDRGLSKQYEGIQTTILGTFPNAMPYRERIALIYKSLKNLFKHEGKNNNQEIWYYFGLQMAVFCCFLNKNKHYMFEESDMTHLGVNNRLFRWLLEQLNKRIIRKSFLSVFTSEGFLQYHFGSSSSFPNNTVVMPNKIHPGILNLPIIPKREAPKEKIRFGFVGFIRYQAVYNMAEVISRLFPEHEFHFFGEVQLKNDEELFYSLKNRSNVFFHGFFKNPEQLPDVYASIDVVVSTYDITSINVKYAEPNKLYESIYFRTPIIVSKDTFLETQVLKYKSGWAVNAFDEESICECVHKIEKEVKTVTENMNAIPREEGVDSSRPLADKLISCNL